MDRVSLKRILTMKKERIWNSEPGELFNFAEEKQANTVGSHESRSRVAPV